MRRSGYTKNILGMPAVAIPRMTGLKCIDCLSLRILLSLSAEFSDDLTVGILEDEA